MKSPQLEHFRCHFFTKGVDKRLSHDDVCTIIFRDDFGDASEADQKAKMLFTLSKRMSNCNVLEGKTLAR